MAVAKSHALPDVVEGLNDGGCYAEALALLDDGLRAEPSSAQLYFLRGRTLFRWGRLREAHASSLRAVELGLEDTDAFRQLGWSSLWTFDREGTEQWMARAVSVAPHDWRAYFGWGTAALACGHIGEALARFSTALELEPGRPETLNNLVVCHLDQKNPIAAEVVARLAVESDSTESMAWANLGLAIARQRRYAEAQPLLERAMELEAASGEATDVFVNYCNCLRDAGDVEAAIAVYERLLPLQPNVNAHMDYGFSLLAAGRLPEGWRQYEFRWLTNVFVRRYPNFDRPAWNGQPLGERTVLLWAEQGLGDIIQFIRYAPLVKTLGATVVVVVRAELRALIATCPGIDQVVDGDTLPHFDFHLPLMSLPYVFGSTEQTIPNAVPYLHAAEQSSQRWRAWLPDTTKLRIGLVWAGSASHYNDRFRSLSLAMLEPVLSVGEVQFVSLQKEHVAADLVDRDILNAGAELADFDDTLAVIDNLDLVITVDTSVAHLAGAAGKPVWILLPYPADFRWLQTRDDTPWYPTARLFRQDSRRDWKPVLARVAAELQSWRNEVRGLPVASSFVPARPQPTLPPVPEYERFSQSPHGLSAFARTRHGLFQYLPSEPIEGASLAAYGQSREGEVVLVASMLRTGGVVVEASPGIGAHTIPLSRAIGASGQLFALEPRRIEHRILCTNLATNGATNVTPMCRGLGAIVLPGIVDRAALASVEITGRVPVLTGAIDTVDSMRLSQLDLLKINDGAQALPILAGADESVWRLRPILFVRVADLPGAEGIAHKLKEMSYRCWRHEAVLFDTDNFNLTNIDLFSGHTSLGVLGVPEEVEYAGTLDGCTEIG